MAYVSVNELDHFQFHDAEITGIELTGDTMTWCVSAINAMTSNTQNNHEKDMCVEKARMTFEDVLIEKIEFSAYKVYNAERELLKSVDAITAGKDEYAGILAGSTSRYCFIYAMCELAPVEDDAYRTCFNIDGGTGNYYLTFTFSKATVQWDAYNGEAWYEHPRL